MHTDIYGQQVYTENDLCGLMMQDPDRSIQNVLVNEMIHFNDRLAISNIPKLVEYQDITIPVSQFDKEAQTNWFMPKEYYELDIAKWVLDQCKTEESLQRAGQELLEYNSRGMLVLLQYLKYLVDTMRKHSIIWGVGRGSSVASYVLFLIGVHRIDSLFYDLPIDEFLK